MDPGTPVFTAKCYWPGVSEDDVVAATKQVARDARRRGERGLECLGAILFPQDELVLCLFRGTSPGAIRQASERAGMPCERVMKSVWLLAE